MMIQAAQSSKDSACQIEILEFLSLSKVAQEKGYFGHESQLFVC
jgi:hypothetical protein